MKIWGVESVPNPGRLEVIVPKKIIIHNFVVIFSSSADSYTNLFGPVSPKVCTLKSSTRKEITHFINLWNTLSMSLTWVLLPDATVSASYCAKSCPGANVQVTTDHSTSCCILVILLKSLCLGRATARLSQAVSGEYSDVIDPKRCHRANMMPTRQARWYQSKLYQWKDSTWWMLQRWNWSCFNSSFSQWKWCCWAAMQCLVTKKSTNLRQA